MVGCAVFTFAPLIVSFLAGADIDGCTAKETSSFVVRIPWRVLSQKKARTIRFVAPFRHIVQTATLVDFDAAVA